MTDPMTPEELQACRERAGAATAGSRLARLLATVDKLRERAERSEAIAATSSRNFAAEVARADAAQRETAATRAVLAALTETFEAVLAEADRPKGGMSVPFQGDFVGALRLPSVLGNMRWWAREARRVLAGEAGTVEHWAKAGEKP